MAGSRTPAHSPRSKLFGTRAADRGRLPTPQCAGLFLSALGQTGDAIEQARPTALLWYLAGFGHFCGGGGSGATFGRFFFPGRGSGRAIGIVPIGSGSGGLDASSFRLDVVGGRVSVLSAGLPPARTWATRSARVRRSSPRTGRRTWPGAVVWPPPMRRISPMKCAACRASRSCVAASSARSLAMVAACWSACAWAEPSRALSAMRTVLQTRRPCRPAARMRRGPP
jgi:hypothetical protein